MSETNAEEVIAMAKLKGIDDPEIYCENHNFRTTLSKLSPLAKIALDSGLDVNDGECLLSN